MEITKSRIKKCEKLTYTQKEKKRIVKTAIKMLGQDKVIIITIEEITELMEVILNAIKKECDYLHLVEEIVDVELHMMMLDDMYHVRRDGKDIKNSMNLGKLCALDCLGTFNKAQFLLCKVGRGKAGKEKAIKAYYLCEAGIRYLKKVFKVKKNDLDTMLKIKLERLEIREKDNTMG